MLIGGFIAKKPEHADPLEALGTYVDTEIGDADDDPKPAKPAKPAKSAKPAKPAKRAREPSPHSEPPARGRGSGGRGGGGRGQGRGECTA